MRPSLKRMPSGWLPAVLLLLLCPGQVGAEDNAELPPNIVLIVADDLGWNDVGYHNPEIRTPHMDRLVATGVDLDQFYVMPQCTPTRVALMTGRYPSRFGNHCTQASNERALPPGTTTVAAALQAAGYQTALCGKWHLGSLPAWGPNHHGFDHSYGSLAGAVGMYDHRYRFGQPQFTRTWHRNQEFLDDDPGHATDLVTAEAVSWLEDHAEQPFFLYVPYQSVHVPLVEDNHWLRLNEHITDPDRRLFAAAVTHMDDCIGQLVETLEKLGVRERTLIIFTSDNGGLHNHAGGTYPPPDSKLTNFSSNLPLRGQKGQTYEGGIRVPAFANWPGTLPPSQVTAPLHAVDVPVMLARLGSAQLPTEPPLDGQDLWSVVRGAEPAASRTLYWLWGTRGQRVALREGDWKLVRSGPDAPLELFHLAEDPEEKQDLASSQPEKLAHLAALLDQEQQHDAELRAKLNSAPENQRE